MLSAGSTRPAESTSNAVSRLTNLPRANSGEALKVIAHCAWVCSHLLIHPRPREAASFGGVEHDLKLIHELKIARQPLVNKALQAGVRSTRASPVVKRLLHNGPLLPISFGCSRAAKNNGLQRKQESRPLPCDHPLGHCVLVCNSPRRRGKISAYCWRIRAHDACIAPQ